MPRVRGRPTSTVRTMTTGSTMAHAYQWTEKDRRTEDEVVLKGLRSSLRVESVDGVLGHERGLPLLGELVEPRLGVGAAQDPHVVLIEEREHVADSGDRGT